MPNSTVQVLVIDDETDSREFVAFVLEQAGARVTTATSAGEGFAALTQSQPDVLLSDIGMPNMDGYMVIQNFDFSNKAGILDRNGDHILPPHLKAPGCVPHYGQHV